MINAQLINYLNDKLINVFLFLMVEECVPQQQCESFMTEKVTLKEIKENSGTDNEEYRQCYNIWYPKVCMNVQP